MANVGVNASHEGQGLRSPRFSDGSFEFVTIPEQKQLQNLDGQGGHLVRYRDVSCFNWPQRSITDFLSPRVHDLVTHYDPEFEEFTYGDECGRAGRAAALKKVRKGDLLFFLARLTDYDLDSHKFLDKAGFYLIGYLEIEAVLEDVRRPLEMADLDTYGDNAHIRRAQACPELFYDGFYIFKGSAQSRRFQRAVPFGRAEAELLLRDRNGQAWNWDSHRSDLQVIGSYTRACRCILDPQVAPEQADRTASFLRLVQIQPK